MIRLFPSWGTVSPIEGEIRRFDALCENLSRRSDFVVERPFPQAVVLFPKPSPVSIPEGKRIALTFMGLVHGNEWAGGAVVTQLLSLFVSRELPLEFPTAFLLGNPEAARRNLRFIDCDLNRSFGAENGSLREQRRAAEISGILKDTAYFVDFHQVMRPSDRAFFIFPFSPASFAFARAIAPNRTIITHRDPVFSSDALVSGKGGAGITLELGETGLEPGQIALGVESGKAALREIAQGIRSDLGHPEESCGEVYGYAPSVPWPDGKHVRLMEGLTNFMDLPNGTKLADVDGRPFILERGGRILFPKYLTAREQRRLKTPPRELCRILQPVDPADLLK